jgi:hypothetical protein
MGFLFIFLVTEVYAISIEMNMQLRGGLLLIFLLKMYEIGREKNNRSSTGDFCSFLIKSVRNQ